MAVTAAGKARRTGLMRGLSAWAERVGLGRKLTLALAAAALLSGAATYAAMTGTPLLDTGSRSVLLLLNVNLALLLLLGAVVAKRLVDVWARRRRNLAGSRLHIRLVGLFSVVAVAPTIIVAVSSFLFFSFGVQSWFSERVRTALDGSVDVAEAYLLEHQQLIKSDALAMASDLNRDFQILSMSPARLAQVVGAQSAVRALTEAVLFEGTGRIVARSGFSFALEFEVIPDWALKEAQSGSVALVRSDNDDRIRALVRLDRYPDHYLYIGRFVDPNVISQIERVRSAVDQYERLEGQRSDFQITFSLVFLVVAMLFLVAAVWVGLTFAGHLAEPIQGLVAAAEQVRAGDLSARVPDGEGEEEFSALSRAFNRMTSQLQSQQRELLEANQQLETRRRFTEAVLAGVSAGVIGLDRDGRINLPNRSASTLLAIDLEKHVGTPLAEAFPEISSLFEAVERRPDRPAQSQIQFVRRGRTHVFLARIVAERVEPGDEVLGYVVTFDEVTELLAAQRKAAWADVARRIAHEIKNPLTPIQLSAERLKRRYLRQIGDDPETFSLCTDTIIRHVGDIGRMVDEFSSFARMPAPDIRPTDLRDLVRQGVFLQRNAQSDIEVRAEMPEGPIVVPCDARQIAQALVNLLKNAAESIQARMAEGDGATGLVLVRLEAGGDHVSIAVEDNGKGLPVAERDRLAEPYVTTRAKGTGLGLAIVKKIMEDHSGQLVFDDREGGGARVELILPALAMPAAPVIPMRAGLG